MAITVTQGGSAVGAGGKKRTFTGVDVGTGGRVICVITHESGTVTSATINSVPATVRQTGNTNLSGGTIIEADTSGASVDIVINLTSSTQPVLTAYSTTTDAVYRDSDYSGAATSSGGETVDVDVAAV